MGGMGDKSCAGSYCNAGVELALASNRCAYHLHVLRSWRRKMSRTLDFQTRFIEGGESEDGEAVSEIGCFAERISVAMAADGEPITSRVSVALAAGIDAYGNFHEGVGGDYSLRRIRASGRGLKVGPLADRCAWLIDCMSRRWKVRGCQVCLVLSNKKVCACPCAKQGDVCVWLCLSGARRALGGASQAALASVEVHLTCWPLQPGMPCISWEVRSKRCVCSCIRCLCGATRHPPPGTSPQEPKTLSHRLKSPRCSGSRSDLGIVHLIVQICRGCGCGGKICVESILRRRGVPGARVHCRLAADVR